MKLNNTLRALSAAAVLATASLSASAAFVVLDDWEMNVPGFTPNLTKDIGHLNFSGGSATVTQQTTGAGQVYVGAKFIESGNIFSVGYTKENAVGSADSGFPLTFAGGAGLQLVFTGVGGKVDFLNVGGGYHYSFTSGTYKLQSTLDGLTFSDLASGSIVGIGGNTASTNIIGGSTGDSTVLATVMQQIGAFHFNDTTGASLASDMAAGEVLMQLTTTNTLNPSSVTPGGCSFDGGLTVGPCVSVQVTSTGTLDLVRDIPEPGSLALVGLGLLGLSAMRRRQSSK